MKRFSSLFLVLWLFLFLAPKAIAVGGKNPINLFYLFYVPQLADYSDTQLQWIAQKTNLTIGHTRNNDSAFQTDVAPKMDKLRQLNPNIKILLYKHSRITWKNNPYAGPPSWQWIADNHPEWFKDHNPDGTPQAECEWLDPRWGKSDGYCMEYTVNNGWWDYFAQTLLGTVKNQGWDGIFADQTVPKWYYGEDFAKRVWSYFRDSGKLYVANGGSCHSTGFTCDTTSCNCCRTLDSNPSDPCVCGWCTTLLDNTSGYMDETFTNHACYWPQYPWADENRWNSQIYSLEQSVSKGKYFLAVAHNRDDHYDEDLSYTLSSFLLAAGEKSYFLNYHCSYSQETYEWDYQLGKKFYETSLGNPLGARYKKNGVWQRDFTGGKVLVNSNHNQSYTVNLGGVFKTVDGVNVANYTLDPHSGDILLGQSITTPTPTTTPVFSLKEIIKKYNQTNGADQNGDDLVNGLDFAVF